MSLHVTGFKVQYVWIHRETGRVLLQSTTNTMTLDEAVAEMSNSQLAAPEVGAVMFGGPTLIPVLGVRTPSPPDTER